MSNMIDDSETAIAIFGKKAAVVIVVLLVLSILVFGKEKTVDVIVHEATVKAQGMYHDYIGKPFAEKCAEERAAAATSPTTSVFPSMFCVIPEYATPTTSTTTTSAPPSVVP